MAINGMAGFPAATGYAPGNGQGPAVGPVAGSGDETKKSSEGGQQQVLTEAERRKMSDAERSRYDSQVESALNSARNERLSGMQQQLGSVSERRAELENRLGNAQDGSRAALEYNAALLASRESDMSRNYSYEYARTLAAVLSLDPGMLEE